jgi:hypothetical protein
MLRYNMFRSLVCAFVLVGCTSPPTGQEDMGRWDAPIEFCLRQVEAAKTRPEYLVDICVYECNTNPDQVWCDDLRKITDDTRRYSTSTNN